MATTANVGTEKTLLQWAKERDPDGGAAVIAEILDKNHPTAKLMPFVESNRDLSHEATVRTKLPESYMTLISEGTAPSTGDADKVTSPVGHSSSVYSINQRLAKLGGTLSQTLLSEVTPHIESVQQTVETQLFYGNTAKNKRHITGLDSIYYTTNASTNPVGANVLSASVAANSGSDCASIFLLGLGPEGIFGFFPKGSKAGLQNDDWGVTTVTDSNNKKKRMYEGEISQDFGVFVKNWKCGGRVGNIDRSVVASSSYSVAAGTAPNLVKLTRTLNEIVKKMPGNKYYWFMDTATFLALQFQIDDLVKGGGGLTYENVDGFTLAKWCEHLVIKTDGLAKNEGTLAA